MAQQDEGLRVNSRSIVSSASFLTVDSLALTVSWDLNLKSSAERLAPYDFEFRNISEASIVIEQRNEQRNEPGSPASGTG
jgi:hypothetical protein